jgi:hypothetical protein
MEEKRTRERLKGGKVEPRCRASSYAYADHGGGTWVENGICVKDRVKGIISTLSIPNYKVF